MAITISGENNNDRILASDGVIDQISGFNIVGVITATTFTGNLIGNVTGNLTGNVNNTSPLLLQTGGYERLRLTGNNEIGIAGANYGSAGQVLTSGGSGSAVSWTTIPTQVTIANNADNRVITGGSGTNLNGESTLTHNAGVLSVNEPSLSTDGKIIVKGNDTDNHDIITAYSNTSTRGSFAIRNGTGVAPSFLVGTRGGSETLGLMTNGTERLRIDSSGHVLPAANNTYDLGSTSLRWRNIYTADLHCSNKGSSNDVDGTWGDYTIQEGETDLFLINNRSGKKYKFNLTEVS